MIIFVSCSDFLSTLYLIMAPNYRASYTSVGPITGDTINSSCSLSPQVAEVTEHFNVQLKERLTWWVGGVKVIPAWTTNLRQSVWGLSAPIPWKGASHLCYMIYQVVWPLPSIVHPSFIIIDSLVSVGEPARTLWPLPEDSNQWDITMAIKQWGVWDSNLLLHLSPRCKGWILANQDFKSNDHQFEVSSSTFFLRYPWHFAPWSPMRSISVYKIEIFIEPQKHSSQKIWRHHPRG